MTDRKSATKAERSERRRQRYEARSKMEKKLGRKLRKGEIVDHKSPRKGKKKYNNSDGNLRVMTEAKHKKITKSGQGMTGGRPKGKVRKTTKKKGSWA